MKRQLLGLLASAALGAPAFAQNIAFTGFNADGNDNLAFVTLTNIASGTVISFSDNERNASGWIDNAENAFSWTATSNIAAGTIVKLDGIGGSIATATSNLGTIAALAGGGTNIGIGNSNEAVFAFTGSYASPTTFLAVIGNDTQTDTGSSANPAPVSNSLFLTGDWDIMQYTGPRSGLANFTDYLPYLTDATYWSPYQDGSGDQSADGIAPDLPFSSTAFTVVPEPSAYATILGAAALLGVALRRRARR